jgi:hypothetical protein
MWLSYVLDDRSSIPGGGTCLFSLPPCPYGLGVLPALLRNGYGGSFHKGKLPGRDADHLPPCIADVKKTWSHTFIPIHVFMASCLLKYRLRHHDVIFS